MADRAESAKLQQDCAPRKVLHFSDGVLQEDSSEEYEPPLTAAPVVDPRTLPWAPFLLHWALQLGTQALAVCDYLGEHLANWFGITAPKYRYEIEHGQVDDDEELKQEPGWQRPAELVQVTAQQPAQGPRY
ncbi:protein FAM177A1 [Rhipicephalus sanguineus]|uniref:protein FAM177A1 n=1 Tax=Rhipicephalus sanguineus TaxID=34632 RepID=UPI001893270F|nr:protein FAM177A1 [Rhipicephalus sanguineus]